MRVSEVKSKFSAAFQRPLFWSLRSFCFGYYGRFVSIVPFWSFRLLRFGRYDRFVLVVSLVSVVSFRFFRSAVSGFSTCRH